MKSIDTAITSLFCHCTSVATRGNKRSTCFSSEYTWPDTHTHTCANAQNTNIKIMTPVITRSVGLISVGDCCCGNSACLVCFGRGEMKREHYCWSLHFKDGEITHSEGYRSPQCREQEQCCQLSCSCRRTPRECSSRTCRREDRQGNAYRYRPSPRHG